MTLGKSLKKRMNDWNLTGNMGWLRLTWLLLGTGNRGWLRLSWLLLGWLLPLMSGSSSGPLMLTLRRTLGRNSS